MLQSPPERDIQVLGFEQPSSAGASQTYKYLRRNSGTTQLRVLDFTEAPRSPLTVQPELLLRSLDIMRNYSFSLVKFQQHMCYFWLRSVFSYLYSRS